jgi:hypothetical protein
MERLKNNKLIAGILIIFIGLTCFSFLFYRFISHNPYGDELHSYFLPGSRFFLNGHYNLFNPRAIDSAFGHPPLYHLYLWGVGIISDYNMVVYRTVIYLSNLLMLLWISLKLCDEKRNILSSLLFFIIVFFQEEVFLNMFQIFPDILSACFFLLFLLSLKDQDRKLTYIYAFVCMGIRASSILLVIPLLVNFIYSNRFKKYDFIHLGLISLILSFWNVIVYTTKDLRYNFNDGLVFSLDNFWHQVKESFNLLYNQDYYGVFLILFVLLLAIYRSKKDLAVIAFVIFYFLVVSLYHLQFIRYHLPVFLVMIYFLMHKFNLSSLNRNRFKHPLLLTFLLIVIHHFVLSSSHVFVKHLRSPLRSQKYYSIYSKYFYPKIKNYRRLYSGFHEFNTCLALNLIDQKDIPCFKIKPFSEGKRKIDLKPGDIGMYVGDYHRDSEEFKDSLDYKTQNYRWANPYRYKVLGYNEYFTNFIIFD